MLSGLAALAVALTLSGCTGISLPSFSTSSEPPPQQQPAATVMPSKYSPDEFVGRWGYTSYHKESDRARTVSAAGRLCRTPYVIAKGPNGGVMMHLADEKQPSELRLKGSPEGKDYIGPDTEPGGGAKDREIISFDGRVLITRFLDPDAAKRYGNLVYVRCGPRA